MGPRTNPCGTPQVMWSDVDLHPPSENTQTYQKGRVRQTNGGMGTI